MAAGAQHRFGCAPPDPDPTEFAEFDAFVDEFMKKNWKPIHAPNEGLEEWLLGSNYTEREKEKLRKCFVQDADVHWREKKVCGSFNKDEFYLECKFARSINARHDLLKCMLGPLVQEIEREVFKHPAFIKKIPVRERPAYINEIMRSELPIIVEGDDGLMLEYSSDYSAFESLFTRRLIEACEARLFRYMLGGGEWAVRFCNLVDTVCWRTNANRYSSGLRLEVEAKRMSGEMFTSLGNSFTNLCVLSFLYEKYIKNGIQLNEKHFEALGLRCKLEKHDDPAEASFCGQVYHPQAQQIIRDPRATLIKLGWSRMPYVYASGRTKLKLLRLKALSMAYESASCPIIAAVAKRLLELTRSAAKRDRYLYTYCTRWEKEWLEVNRVENVQFPPIDPRTRDLFAKIYGIPVADQLEAERIAGTMSLGAAPQAFVELLRLPAVLADYWDTYVSPSLNAGIGWTCMSWPLASWDQALLDAEEDRRPQHLAADAPDCKMGCPKRLCYFPLTHGVVTLSPADL